jgi:RNA ligase (TIGR02306 family)
MSGFEVKIEQLKVFPHPNADLLEVAQVGLYRAVIGKGRFRDGDWALYVPEQAILPDELIEELGLTGKLAGSAKNRVKAVRLRQELSQGIVCRPKALDYLWSDEGRGDFDPSVDFAEALGIVKWVPPIPVGMAGEVEPAPDLIRWIEIENIKRFPGLFAPGELVVATEKVHGTCCLYTYNGATGEEWVSSKGFGGKSLALKPSETNLYWRAVHEYNLKAAAQQLLKAMGTPNARVAFFGEVYGRGVQDLHYGKDASRDETLGYALFDVALDYLTTGVMWLAQDEIDNMRLGVPRVPLIYQGPYDYPLLAAFAEGQTRLGADNIREGIVVRPVVERHSDVLGGRAIAKFVSEAYLTRKGETTEFE